MQIQVLKVKLHKASVTGASVNYHGSLSIDEDIMEHCGIRKYEKVLVGTRMTWSSWKMNVELWHHGRRKGVVVNGQK